MSESSEIRTVGTVPRLVERLSDELIAVAINGEAQIWTRNLLRKDRPGWCKLCQKPLLKGQDCFRPLGNVFNRYERVHAGCILAWG